MRRIDVEEHRGVRKQPRRGGNDARGFEERSRWRREGAEAKLVRFVARNDERGDIGKRGHFGGGVRGVRSKERWEHAKRDDVA